MVDRETRVRVLCEGPCTFVDLDVAALAARVGRDYSLIGRRCRCRITPGCPHWNRFYYHCGVFRPLWTDADVWRWTAKSRAIGADTERAAK